MREVEVAKYSGFCFGVSRAVKTVYALIESGTAGSIYTLGDIIHNPTVVTDLRAAGVRSVSADELPAICDGAADGQDVTVVIRTHGVERAYSDMLRRRAAECPNLHVVDCTCPFVEKIHEIVKNNSTEKTVTLIFGDDDHPEVRGIKSCVAGRAYCFTDKTQLEERIIPLLSPEDEVIMVSQTTQNLTEWKNCQNFIKNLYTNAKIFDTICSVTEKRQNETRALAGRVDVMVVIGGKNSSNTTKLYSISGQVCPETYLVENAEECRSIRPGKDSKVGITAGASTPDYTIKEVIANMSDVTLENKEMTMDDVLQSEEFNKSLKLPRNGEIVDGKVHQVNEDEVIVNLGVKKDGILQKSDASLEEGQTLADAYKVGDEIKAKVIKTDDGDGGILLSTKKLEYIANWEEVVKAYEDKSVIEVKVTRAVRGGVIAEYKEFSGFIPLSQLSDHFVVDAEEFVGQTMNVRVFRIDPAKTKAVFSHKMYLADERKKLVQEIWEKLNVDDVVEGTVMRFTDYGAFVDIGGVDGLLHISEISWGKLKHPEEVLKIGDIINVKILSLNEEKGKISLGLKQTQPEPWTLVGDKYQVGDVLDGKVVQTKEYGAFVELEAGLDGLVHISEIANKRVENVSDELKVGETVKVKIMEIDPEKRRISLSIKAALPEEEAAAEDEAPAEEAPAEEAEAQDEE